MEPIALKDPNVLPTDEVLKTTLGDSYTAYEELIKAFRERDVTHEWRYYNDGKAWLCKLPFKKKNLGWLHVYKDYFGVTFHFLERHLPVIEELEIDKKIKEDFYAARNSGKLQPMVIWVKDKKLPEDILTVMNCKKKLK